MKRFFILLAACMMFFACGNTNEGVEYVKEAKKAAEQGDMELVGEYMQKYAEWCQEATEEQLAEAEKLIKDVVTDDVQLALENFYNNAADIAEDASAEIERAFEVAAEKTEEASEELEKALEKGAEKAEEALEQGAEKAEEAVNQAMKALEGLMK